MGWPTHDVTNQFDELQDHNLYATDHALQEAVTRHGGASAHGRLGDYGALMGTADSYAQADLANRFLPELKTFDARGRRVDQVNFHPAWHELLARYRQAGLISSPFRDNAPGRWAAWAAGFYMHAQIEAGTLCPSTMTLGAIPLLQREPALWAQVGDKLFSDGYDTRDLPIAQKSAIYLGMGMTEKQGGSDVRANQTTATPIGADGRGAEYLLRVLAFFPLAVLQALVRLCTDLGVQWWALGLLFNAVAHLLFEQLRDLPEGDLSRVRANLVKQETLHQLALKLDIPACLKLGEGELKSGGQRRPSILADALEALIGAVFLDAGYDAAEKWVHALFQNVEIISPIQKKII